LRIKVGLITSYVYYTNVLVVQHSPNLSLVNVLIDVNQIINETM